MHLDLGEPAGDLHASPHCPCDPAQQRVVESLMRAHFAADDRAGAEKVYKETHRRFSSAKLGDPADAIEQLRIELRASMM